MATYNYVSGLVKYAGEHTDAISAQLTYVIANPGTKDLYVKHTISNQGALKWTFDDGTTEKTENPNGRSYVV